MDGHSSAFMAAKLSRGLSCVLCQQRKLRCDRNKPCHNCAKAGVECNVLPPQPPRRRKRVLDEKSLLRRLKEYEELLSQHGINFEPVDATLPPSDRGHSKDEHPSEQQGSVTPSSGAEGNNSRTVTSGDSVENKWFHYHSEYGDPFRLLQGGSADINQGPTSLHGAFDSVFGGTQSFPFAVVAPSNISVAEKRPTGVQIFQLWQIYLTNVDPLLKITHTPTLQKQIIEAGAHPDAMTADLEALMFCLYLIAITSLTELQTSNTFGEDKSVLLARFHGAAQQSLINAGFMRTSNLMVLQAYCLYLLSIRSVTDPRTLVSLIGIAVRIAQRLGLHRDGSHFGVSAFEAEQRRRLWWNIVMLDKRVAVFAGSTITAFSTAKSDCHRPLNANDSDLHPNSKETPLSSSQTTEMAFVLSRIELATVTRPEQIYPLPSSNRPVVLPNHRAFRPPTDMDRYCDYVEETYLEKCDENVPIQYFTLISTRQTLCKLQLLSNAEQFVSKGDTISAAEREWLFTEAIMMVEYDNIVQSAESCSAFLWYGYMSFPFPAYLILAPELRRTCSGRLCERAWAAITENHVRRGVISTLHSPMHIAYGNALLQAWDAREAAQLEQGHALQSPEFITLLRQLVTKRGSAPVPGLQEASTSGGGVLTAPGLAGVDDWSGLEGIMPSLMHDDGDNEWLHVSQLASIYY